MIIHVKQACEFRNRDGETYRCPNGFIGCPPEWVADNEYFKALCADGLVTAHIDSKSAEASAAADESKKGKRK